MYTKELTVITMQPLPLDKRVDISLTCFSLKISILTNTTHGYYE